MSPIIEIRPNQGEAKFEPIIVEVSKKAAGEIAVDIVANPLELNSQDKNVSKEKMELAQALIEAAKSS